MIIDTKYLGLISLRLRNYTKKSNRLWNCSCPLCGDSQKDSRKARGYFFAHKERLWYKCHNCGEATSFQNFLKKFDPNLYKEYLAERIGSKFGNKNKSDEPDPTKMKFDLSSIKSVKDNVQVTGYLKRFEDMPIEHQNYWGSRKLPASARKYIFYTPAFYAFSNLVAKKKVFKEQALRYDHPRFIIPFYDEEGKIFAFQGRELPGRNSGAKYITIKLDGDAPKVFGLDRVDRNKPIYIVEGPVDSLFLQNCLAASGGDLLAISGRVRPKKEIFAFDNEPRSPQTVDKMNKAIEAGKSVVIFPSSIKKKDINDMVIAGLDVQHVISENVYEGLAAKMAMTRWAKC